MSKTSGSTRRLPEASISATSNGFGIYSSAYRTSCCTGFVHC